MHLKVLTITYLGCHRKFLPALRLTEMHLKALRNI